VADAAIDLLHHVRVVELHLQFGALLLPFEDKRALLREIVKDEAARDQYSANCQHRLPKITLHDVSEEHAHPAERSRSIVLGMLLPAQLNRELLTEHATSRPHNDLITSYELLGLALDVTVLIVEELPDLASRQLSLLLHEQAHQSLQLSLVHILDFVADRHFPFDIFCCVDPVEAILTPTLSVVVLVEDAAKLFKRLFSIFILGIEYEVVILG